MRSARVGPAVATCQGRVPARHPPWHEPQILRSAASGVLLLTGWMLSRVAPPFAGTTYLIAAIIGGWSVGSEALAALARDHTVTSELLIATAAVVAIALGRVGEAAGVTLLYSMSGAVERCAERKSRGSIQALMAGMPTHAVVRRDGRELDMPVEDLDAGEMFVVPPGHAIATDGVVVVGVSEVDQRPVTGERVPVTKQPGDHVFGGSVNAVRTLEIRATRTVADSTVARIIALLGSAHERQGPREQTLERFGTWYRPVVLLAGVGVATLPPLLAGGGWTTWVGRAAVWLVAATPFDLVRAGRLTRVAALGASARRGVLIQGGPCLEEFAKVGVVACSKTGVLTRGKPEVTNVLATMASGIEDMEVLRLAVTIESRSQHPLARAIVRYAHEQGIEPAQGVAFPSLHRGGASAMSGGRTVYVATPTFFETAFGVLVPIDMDVAVSRWEREGKTVVVVGDAASVWGAIAVRDQVRPDAARTVAALKALGIARVAMVTGDSARAGAALGRTLGLDEVMGDLAPEDKVRQVRELTAKYGRVAMVGNGVDDAAARAAAAVGVAIGAAGADVPMGTADVVVMADALEPLVDALRLARRTERVAEQNLWLSACVITGLVVGAITGVVSLPLAMLGHGLGECLVMTNGLRTSRTSATGGM